MTAWMRSTWVLTVDSDSTRRSAISRLVHPWPMLGGAVTEHRPRVNQPEILAERLVLSNPRQDPRRPCRRSSSPTTSF